MIPLTDQMLVFLEGAAISLGLIVAIGPQNAYVLRKGLRGRHVFTVASVCFVVDGALIALGGAGIGGLAAGTGMFSTGLALGGAAFLFWYGFVSFRKAFNPDVISEREIESAGAEAAGKGLRAAALTALAMTLLNPHVYIDTLVIIGGLTANHPADERLAFVIGAIAASAVWFYGIGYGARMLAPLFSRPAAWTVLDSLVGLIMWSVALGLLWSEFAHWIGG